MSLIGPEYVGTLRETLSYFQEEAGRFAESYGSLPAAGSQAETEQATFARPETIVTACCLGTTLIDFGGEHISAFVKTITEPIEIIASWTCVRSMLESCSLAAWFLDPTINAHKRVGRVFAIRYEEMEQQVKFLRASGNDPAALQALQLRIDDVEQVALNLGYPRVLDKKGKRDGFVERLPAATEMIRMMLNEEMTYRLLSAVAHGHSWAIRGLGWSVSGPDVNVGGVMTKAIQKSINPDAIAIMGLSAAKALARPLWNQCRFYGWKELQLEELLEKVFDKLGAHINQRFWRS